MNQQRVVDSWQRIEAIPPDRIMYRIGYSDAKALACMLYGLIVLDCTQLPKAHQRAYRAAVLLTEPLGVKLQNLTKKSFAKHKTIAINQKMAEGFMLAYEAGCFNNVLLRTNPLVKKYFEGVLYLLYEALGRYYPL
ncbi:MAG: hypothetical protein F9K23_11665 [Bacteroidetes bacterium]|nr:MAG: hypothetical protein F9K23_11665 [Bacteroidota bacterium]